jgi:Ca-activated chloride channel family protein
MIRFADPMFFLLFALLPLVVWLAYWIRKQRRGALRFSDLGRFKRIRSSGSVRRRHTVMALRLIALSLLILAAARPQTSETLLETDYTEGVDILIALDCSGSMQAMDLDYKKKNRLDVAKEVTADFIQKRSSDRIGLIVFAGDAYTQCPMTLDYSVLLDILKLVTIGMDGTIPDGTAIGLATARCLKRLENSQTKSKVVVLLTDGMNNTGEVSPMQAATIAAQIGIKIYTVGTGSLSGVAPVKVSHPLFGTSWQAQSVDLDEKTLTEMANMTGGKYFRAGDRKELEQIFEEIDKLETTKIEGLGEHRYHEVFGLFALLALCALVLEVVLSQTVYRTLP